MRQQRNHNRPKPKFALGDEVYFQAFAEQAIENSFFLCKGKVVRLPEPNSPVYKIVVTSVDVNSIVIGHNPVMAQGLLGRRIAKQENQMSYKINDWLVRPQTGWIHLGDRELQKIDRLLRSK
jgi:hypothetical protein